MKMNNIDLVRILKTMEMNRLKKFKSKISFNIEKKNYILKTAENYDELLQALQLRHTVFYEELLKKKDFREIDVDRFDLNCDHLCIFEKSNGRLVGTYRMNSSVFNRKFYSTTEFKMKRVLKLPGNKLELGRACVHPEFRNGVTIALLWKGIEEYMKMSKSDYLFGCSSVKTTDIDDIKAIYQYLSGKNYITHAFEVKPKGKFRVNKNVFKSEEEGKFEENHLVIKKIPSLLNAYLKAGAVICGVPALDKDFKCFDFFTLLPVSELNLIKEKSRLI